MGGESIRQVKLGERERLQLLKEMRRIFHITHSLVDSRAGSSHM